MNADARITLYGGTGIGSALVLLGAAMSQTVALTGVGLMGAALAVAISIEALDE